MVNVVIPMAGAGSRFANKGYEKPKPFIEFQGKAMILHVLENLKIVNAKYILIAREEHIVNEKKVIDEIKSKYPAEIILIDKLSEGPACTVLYAHNIINKNEPLLIANSDQIVDVNLNNFIKDMKIRDLDGSILTFNDSDPKWSYAKIDINNLVQEVKEKEVISDFATVGIYLFASGKIFVNSALDMIIRNDRVNNEFYVCPTYNYAIKNGLKIGIYNIDKNLMHGTGTPEDLNQYLEVLNQL